MSSKEDSKWERKTWYELKRLCQNVPEAGIHFQSKASYHPTELGCS